MSALLHFHRENNARCKRRAVPAVFVGVFRSSLNWLDRGVSFKQQGERCALAVMLPGRLPLTLFSLLLLFAAGGYAEEIAPRLILKNDLVVDPRHVLSAPKLLQRIQSGVRITLVDVRPIKEYDAIHIPGSIHIPLHFIKTKPHLKGGPMVLVEKGPALHRLASACRELNQKGFDVRILEGGLSAWHNSGGALTGDPARRINLNHISPADFFREKNYAKRLVLDVSILKTTWLQELMPYAVHLPIKEDNGAQLKKIAHIWAANGDKTILVINQNGENYRRLEHHLRQAGLKNVFFLQGGAAAYRQYLKELTLAWQPRRKRLVSANSCSTCMENENDSSKPGWGSN